MRCARAHHHPLADAAPSRRPGDAARRAPRPPARPSRARSHLHTPRGRHPSRAPARSGRAASPRRARSPAPRASTVRGDARFPLARTRLAPLLFSSLLVIRPAYPERARTLTPLATPSARRRSPAGAWTTTPPRALPPPTTTSPARAKARRRARPRPAGRSARRRTRRRPPPPRTAARARGTNGVRVAGRPLAVYRGRKNPGWCGPRSCTCDS